MKGPKIYATVLIIALAFVLGCSSPESRVIGKWVTEQEDGTKQHIELFSDKSIAWEIPGATEAQNVMQYGTWTILSDGRIKADLHILGANLIVLCEVKEKRLIMDIGGKMRTFTKM